METGHEGRTCKEKGAEPEGTAPREGPPRPPGLPFEERKARERDEDLFLGLVSHRSHDGGARRTPEP